MFIRADARGQDLRYIGVGDDREAIVDGPRGGGVFVGSHLAQGKDEREYPAFIVAQVRREIAGRNASKRKRRAVGEAQGVNERGDVLAERHKARFPAQLHAFLRQLLRKLLAA